MPFFISCFERLLLCFTQFGGSSQCLNFGRFRSTAPFSGKCFGPLPNQTFCLKVQLTVNVNLGEGWVDSLPLLEYLGGV